MKITPKSWIVATASIAFLLSTNVAFAIEASTQQVSNPLTVTVGTTSTNTVFKNVKISPNPFYLQIPNATPALNIVYTVDIASNTTTQVIEQILDNSGNVVYDFGNGNPSLRTAGTYTFNWDGTVNIGSNKGKSVLDGNYILYLKDINGTPFFSDKIVVSKCIAPQIAFDQLPNTYFYTGNNAKYSLYYNLKKGSATDNGSTLNLKIYGPTGAAPQEVNITDVKKTNGSYSISWDGLVNSKTATPGEYTYTLSVVSDVNGTKVTGNQLTGNFTVINQTQPNPSVSGLSVSPNPYDASKGQATLSYGLSGSLGYSQVDVAVFSSTDLTNPVKKWAYTKQSNGTNTILWDGKNSNGAAVTTGAYVLKVSGTDGNFTIVPQQLSFTLIYSGANGPSGISCAGFNDVDAADSDCDSIKYVKSIGAMTGNADGTFGQDDTLQRDQIAKIALETFGFYSKTVDYCKNDNPFPDVTESSWSYQYICRALQLGVVTGYQSGTDKGFYKPARSVNRVEFLALLLRNIKDTMPAKNSTSYSDVSIDQWFTPYAKYSLDNGLFTGTKLYPTNYVTRVEVARVLYKLHQLGKI